MIAPVFGGLGSSFLFAIVGLLISLPLLTILLIEFEDMDNEEDFEKSSHSPCVTMDREISNNDFEDFSVNPATGLLMMNGSIGLDVDGNPFGVDLSYGDSDSIFSCDSV